MQINTTQTEVKKISGTLQKPSITIYPTPIGYQAVIDFDIKNNTGDIISTLHCDIPATKWNDFNRRINSTWRPLFEEMVSQHDLTNIVIPDDVDSWFDNKVIENVQ